MAKEKFCTCDEFCQQQDDCPYRVFCDTVHTVGQFLQDLRENHKFCDGFNYMIKLVESDEEEAINTIARSCHVFWKQLQISKENALEDHMEMWDEVMEDPFLRPCWRTLRETFFSYREMLEGHIDSLNRTLEEFRLWNLEL